MSEQRLQKFNSTTDVKKALAGEYQKQIGNYFGDEKKALRFLSSVISAAQRNPKLLECTPESFVNSFMTMASLELMPSDVSGEAYVIPYLNSYKDDSGKWYKVLEAQFQLGYQGMVTLFYRAGCRKIVAEIIHERDIERDGDGKSNFTFVNGEITHAPDFFSERGGPVGAYVIVTLGTGATVSKVMTEEEILDIAQKFSKSFHSKNSPWMPKNDPQLWMWRKTVLKQAAKLVPKNEKLITAIAEDNRDSVIGDRAERVEETTEKLTMGNLLKKPNDKLDADEKTSEEKTADESAEGEKSAKRKRGIDEFAPEGGAPAA